MSSELWMRCRMALLTAAFCVAGTGFSAPPDAASAHPGEGTGRPTGAQAEDLPFFERDYVVGEGDGPVTVKVLASASRIAATVTYYTEELDARAGADYHHAQGTLSFTSADAEKTFQVGIVDDGAIERDESISLFLRDSSGREYDFSEITIVGNDADETDPVGGGNSPGPGSQTGGSDAAQSSAEKAAAAARAAAAGARGASPAISPDATAAPGSEGEVPTIELNSAALAKGKAVGKLSGSSAGSEENDAGSRERPAAAATGAFMLLLVGGFYLYRLRRLRGTS